MNMTLSAAMSLADIRMDQGDEEAARLLNFCACAAERYQEAAQKLVYACAQSSLAKRKARIAEI